MEILTDYNKESLVKIIHNSWNTIMYKFFGNNPNTLYNETPELTIIDNDTQIAMFNRIFYTNLRPENTEQEISEIVDYFDSRKLPFKW